MLFPTNCITADTPLCSFCPQVTVSCLNGQIFYVTVLLYYIVRLILLLYSKLIDAYSDVFVGYHTSANLEKCYGRGRLFCNITRMAVTKRHLFGYQAMGPLVPIGK